MKSRLLFAALLLFISTLSVKGQIFINENFSGGSGATPPSGWVNNIIAGSSSFDQWRYNNPAGRGTSTPISPQFAVFDSDNLSSGGGAENVALESPAVSTVGYSVVKLKWDQYFAGIYNSTDGIYVEVYNGSSWNVIYSNTTLSYPGGASSQDIDVSTYASNRTGVKVRFRFVGNWSWWWIVDNVMLYAPVPVINTNPSNVTMCQAANTSFTVSASNNTGYQWQESINSGSTWNNVTNGGIYGGATTATLALTGVTAGMNTYQYRCIATGSPAATSTAAILTVNSLPTVTTNPPSSVTLCPGDNTTLTAAGTGTGLAYQWQISTNGGGSWSNLSNGAPYSTVATATLNITGATTALNSNQYRCVLSGTCTPSVNTTATVLTVNSIASVTGQPSNSIICPGNNTTFTISATASGIISYQWQVSTNGGSTWSSLSNGAPYSTVTSATLTITAATAGMNNNQYRCVATGSLCTGSATSNAALLTVNNSLVINSQPTNQITCVGSPATFSISALANTYQWQESTNGGSTWNNLSNSSTYNNVSTSVLTINAVPLSMNTYQYRCVMSTVCSAPTSSTAAALTVNTLPAITSNPSNTTVCDGVLVTTNAVFSVTATGAALTYQWQENSGSGYSNIVNNPPAFAGATSATLSVVNPAPTKNGYTYRCVVSGYCSPPAVTTDAILTVNTRPVVNTQPANSLICPGNNATFTIGASATNITYQWQGNTGSGFTNLSNGSAYTGVTSSTLTVVAPASSTNSNNSYRCVISGLCTPSVTSGTAFHFISTPPTIINQPLTQGGCLGGNTSFYVGVSATSYAPVVYQWQMSIDGGATWSNMTNGAPYSGVTTNNMTISGIAITMGGYQFRCVVSTQCSPSATTVAAILNVLTLPAIATGPTDRTVCPGAQTTFTTAATGSGLLYQWQVNTGSGFTNIAGSNPAYTGSANATLQISSAKASMNNYQFRCIVAGSCTPSVTSTLATLKVLNPVNIVSQTITDTVCETSEKKIGLKASGNSLIYQWQQLSSTPGVYTDIMSLPPYSGANTDSLRFTNTPASVSGNVYRCRISETILCNLSFYTNDIPLFVNQAPVSSPAKLNAAFFGVAVFSVPNAGTSFQWQESIRNTGFADITDTVRYKGIFTNTLTINTLGFDMSGNQYRCVVNGVCASPVASKSSLLIVDPALSVSRVNAADITMSVYPNPLSGTQLNINFSRSLKGKTDVRILDKLGKLVYEGTITAGQNNAASIELNTLAAGIYMLQVHNESDNFTHTIQFTKQ